MGFEDFAKAVRFGSNPDPAPPPQEDSGFEKFAKLVQSPVAADTAKLNAQFAPPTTSLGEAASADVSGIGSFLSGLDFTNPSNIPNLIKHGGPMALQLLATAIFKSPTARILGSGAAAIPGRMISQGVNAAQGQPTDLSAGGFAKDAGLNALFQGGAELGGPAMSTVLGKSSAEAAAAKATADAAENIAQAETLGQLKQANKRAAIALGVEDAAKDLEAKRATKIDQLTQTTQENYQQAAAAQQQKVMNLQAKAIEDHAKMLEGLTSKKASAQEAVDREIAKHSESALADLTDEQAEKAIREGLGPRATMPQPVTIEDLTRATSPVQKASQQAVKGVFGGISQKFQSVLEPYGALPIENSTIGDAVRTLKADVKASGGSLTPAVQGLMKEAQELAGKRMDLGKERLGIMTAGGRTVPLSPQYLAKLSDEQFNQLMGGADVAGRVATPKATINQYLGLRSRFLDQAAGATNAVSGRTAAMMADAIDQDIQKVLPQEAQVQLGVLRDEWHQARSTFSNTFRSRLFRASTPDQVAEAIYTGAKTGKNMGHRAELLVNQMKQEAPEQVPLLSQAFTSMLANSRDMIGDVQKMPPGLFKSLYPGTGFDRPEGWVQAVRGQQTAAKIMTDPELMARFNSAVQQGMNSLGSKVKTQALARAEQALAEAPSQQAMIQDSLRSAPPSPNYEAMLSKSLRKAPAAPDREAMLQAALKREPTPQQAGETAKLGLESPAQAGEAAGMEAMKRPFLGRFQTYMAHRMEFDIGLALLGGSGFLTHHPGAAIAGLGYLAGSRAISAALSNPRIGRMYYNFITSPTVEQMGVWAGRMAAASLSEASKESSE